MILTLPEITARILKPVNAVDIDKACKLQAKAEVHFTGEGYEKEILQLIGHESFNDFKGKRELGEPVTKSIAETLQSELSRFKESGTCVRYYDFGESENAKQNLLNTIDRVYNGSGLDKFATEWLLPAVFYRFNDFIVITRPAKVPGGLLAKIKGIFRPASETPEKYIVTVSINSVLDYAKTGDRVEYLIYEYAKSDKGKLYRYLDDAQDIIFYREGETVRINTIEGKEDILKHSKMPARQVGSIFADINNPNICKSVIDAEIPLLRRYLKFDAINVISEVKHAYPLSWMYGQRCDNDKCDNGYILKDGKREPCPVCGGSKYKLTVRPGDVFLIPMALTEVERPSVNGAPAGIIQRDTESMRFQVERLKIREEDIYRYALGMQPFTQIRRTATETDINTKPLEDRNNKVSSYLETVEHWIVDVVAGDDPNYRGATIAYAKRLNLKSEDWYSTEIKSAKESGATQSYIYSLLEEQIYARYNNDPLERERQLLFLQLEPLPGYTIEEVDKMPMVDRKLKYIKQNITQLLTEIEADVNKRLNTYTIEQVKLLLRNKAEENTSADKVMLASVIGIDGTQSLQAIVSDPYMKPENKAGVLKVLFNLSDEEISTIFAGSNNNKHLIP